MSIIIWLICAFLPYSISVEDAIPEVDDVTLPAEESPADNTFSESVSTVAALGRIADLGDLYDARTDNFVGISLYPDGVPGDIIHSTDITHANVDYVRTESLSEKFEKLGVSPSLAVSFMAGFVKASGSGQYLHEDKKSLHGAKASLVYSLRTIQEHVKISSEKSRRHSDCSMLEHVNATHVVIGIEWGADAVLSLEDTNAESSKIQANLEAALKLITMSSQWINFDVERSSTFSLKLHADIIPSHVPQRIRESIDYINNISKLVGKVNDGKGKMMRYILMPINVVRKIIQCESNNTNEIKHISRKITDRFTSMFQKLKNSDIEVKGVCDVMAKYSFIIPDYEFQRFNDLKSELENSRHFLIAEFAKLVVRFREGQCDDATFEDFFAMNEYNPYITEHIWNEVEFLKEAMGTLKVVELFESLGAVIINPRKDNFNILANSYQREVRVISINSIDSRVSISSFTARQVARFLQASTGSKSKTYIEFYFYSTGPTVVGTYREGELKNYFHLKSFDYLLLISRLGDVLLIDGTSYDLITAYNQPEFYSSTVALVDDTFYNVDTKNGVISRTSIGNIITPSKDGITWKRVGSFPNETKLVESVAAVNGSEFYFLSSEGILYKFDTMLKTVTNCAQVPEKNVFNSLLIVNEILYIYVGNSFYSFDGTLLTKLSTPENRLRPGLSQQSAWGNVCCVGGDLGYKGEKLHPVYCYNPKEKKWTADSYTNGIRDHPGVAETDFGTIIVGGQGVLSDGTTTGPLNSIEIFDRSTKIWSYIPTPPGMRKDWYRALSFKFLN